MMHALKLVIAVVAFSVLEACPEPVEGKAEQAPAQTQDGPYAFTTYEAFDDFAAAHLAPRSADTTYVVNFWATWCGPCVKELPYFEQLHAAGQHEGQPVHVTLVTIDLAMAYETSLLPFLEKQQLQAEVVGLRDGDANAWIDRVDPSWSGAIPITVFLRGEQRTFFEKAYHSYAELVADLPN